MEEKLYKGNVELAYSFERPLCSIFLAMFAKITYSDSPWANAPALMRCHAVFAIMTRTGVFAMATPKDYDMQDLLRWFAKVAVLAQNLDTKIKADAAETGDIS